jgi:DNA mismatch endonuclease (patch repair protein)
MDDQVEIEGRTMDILTREQRSHCMSRIKAKNTKPEQVLRAALWSAGLRYRLHYAVMGRPDIVFAARQVAVFVDGCFWHGCPLHSVKPKTNVSFWQNKLKRNIERDINVTARLNTEGWTIIRIWEHEIKDHLDSAVLRVVSVVTSSKSP